MSFRVSAIALILANLVPLAGVLLFGWRVFDVLMLYWVENVIIGVVNLMRMAVCSDGKKWFLMLFFAAHYGLFCFGHLMAVTGLFGDSVDGLSYFSGEASGEWRRAPLWIAVLSIAASHLFSFFSNFIGGGEFRRTAANELMQRPYGRIVVLHVAIIMGAALVQWLGSPVGMLIALVMAKIALDLRLHLSERDRFARGTAMHR